MLDTLGAACYSPHSPAGRPRTVWFYSGGHDMTAAEHIAHALAELERIHAATAHMHNLRELNRAARDISALRAIGERIAYDTRDC